MKQVTIVLSEKNIFYYISDSIGMITETKQLPFENFFKMLEQNPNFETRLKRFDTGEYCLTYTYQII